MLEYELKTVISSNDYNKLIKYFRETLGLDGNTYLQSNHYIDNDKNEIINSGFGLRIRQKNSEFEYTLKVPTNEENKNIEINKIVTSDDLSNYSVNLDEKIKLILENKVDDLSGLKIIGYLTTERIDFNYKNCLFSIDMNKYLDKIDFEIEVEIQEKEQEDIFFSILSENNITYQKAISKQKRFYNKLKDV